MRYIPLLFILLTVNLFESSAQITNQLTKQNTVFYAKKNVDTLARQLNLTRQQIILLDSLERDFLNKRVAIPPQVPLEQRQFIIEEQNKWRRQKLISILSATQLKLYDELILKKKLEIESKRKQHLQKNKS